MDLMFEVWADDDGGEDDDDDDDDGDGDEAAGEDAAAGEAGHGGEPPDADDGEAAEAAGEAEHAGEPADADDGEAAEAAGEAEHGGPHDDASPDREEVDAAEEDDNATHAYELVVRGDLDVEDEEQDDFNIAKLFADMEAATYDVDDTRDGHVARFLAADFDAVADETCSLKQDSYDAVEVVAESQEPDVSADGLDGTASDIKTSGNGIGIESSLADVRAGLGETASELKTSGDEIDGASCMVVAGCLPTGEELVKDGVKHLFDAVLAQKIIAKPKEPSGEMDKEGMPEIPNPRPSSPEPPKLDRAPLIARLHEIQHLSFD